MTAVFESLPCWDRSFPFLLVQQSFVEALSIVREVETDSLDEMGGIDCYFYENVKGLDRCLVNGDYIVVIGKRLRGREGAATYQDSYDRSAQAYRILMLPQCSRRCSKHHTLRPP